VATKDTNGISINPILIGAMMISTLDLQREEEEDKKRGYNDPSHQYEDRNFQGQHGGPPRGYYMPPYGVDPYYYGP